MRRRPLLQAMGPPAGGLIAWFASNPVAANLLMLLILLGGAGSLFLMDKQVFPRFTPQQIEVIAFYPGAGPQEIEESVCVRIEEAIYHLPGVKRLPAEIIEGECNIKVSILPDHDKEQVMSTLRGRVQAIQRPPKGPERSEIRRA